MSTQHPVTAAGGHSYVVTYYIFVTSFGIFQGERFLPTAPGDIRQCVEIIWVVTISENCQHLAGRGRGHCGPPRSGQDSHRNKALSGLQCQQNQDCSSDSIASKRARNPSSLSRLADAVAMETRRRTHAHSAAVQKFQGQTEGKRQGGNEMPETKQALEAPTASSITPGRLTRCPRPRSRGAPQLSTARRI